MTPAARIANRAALTVAGAHLTPSVAAIRPLRVRATPRLSGVVPGSRHVALTFDDGPDPRTTPVLLELLDRAGLHATFFVLGEQLARWPHVGQQMIAAGHELAVHGWTHRCHLLRSPRAVVADIERAYAGVRDVVGVVPRYWRPPHGILTGAGWWAAHRLGLRPVLWSAEGQEWRRGATTCSVRDRVARQLRPGGVVLLHDADTTCPPGSSGAVLGALPALVADWAWRGWRVGPLREHGL